MRSSNQWEAFLIAPATTATSISPWDRYWKCTFLGKYTFSTPSIVTAILQVMPRQVAIMPDGTKPLPEPMLIYHQRCSVAFSWMQFHRRCSWTCWKITLLKLWPHLPVASESISLKQKLCDEIFVIGMAHCQNNNIQCSLWRKFINPIFLYKCIKQSIS